MVDRRNVPVDRAKPCRLLEKSIVNYNEVNYSAAIYNEVNYSEANYSAAIYNEVNYSVAQRSELQH